MTKIKPIGNIISQYNKYITKPNKNINPKTLTKCSLALATAIPIGISTVFKDYNKTVNDNYFQLRIDKTTGKPYKPDIFQNAAAINLFLGNDVLVTAPTGTGKTAIAEYIITKNLKEGSRTFYTTPLKALSNEKFLDFSKIYGEENVGIITGDTKINIDAPIIVMTTEVYRNMATSGLFNRENDSKIGIPEGLKTVIFDELQYLGDIDRGGIWEQAIMFTPKNVQMLSLSATIGNNTYINNWMASVKGQKSISVTPDNNYKPRITDKKETVLINVPSENRHVPLNFELQKAVAEIKIPRGGSKSQKIKAKKEGARLSQSIYAKPKDETYKALTERLHKEGKLPAIYFVFSKKESRHLLKYLSKESEILTNEQERQEIAQIIKKHINNGVYLGEGLNVDALMKGYAVHNAGLLPSQKTLIEELFQKKLIKVVIATETLSAGINMPAKTTVISSPRKPATTSDGGADKKRNLTPNEFHQMAGRAGRRGIDTVGYCIPLSCNAEQTKLYENLMASPSNKLESNLDLDFSFITNYSSQITDDSDLRYMLVKSLFTYDGTGHANENKIDTLIKTYKIKKDLLVDENFIKPDGENTIKGNLIKLLNGYEQIPIINIITNHSLENLDSAQIAGILGGLANIRYNTRGEFPEKPFEMRNCDDFNFVDTAFKTSQMVKTYNRKIEELYPDRELEVDPKIMEHLYTWAELNKSNENSRENWKNIYTGDLKFSIKDEGSLFKEITMTVDLIKQLINVAEAGINLSKTPAERFYYQSLQSKLQDALILIQKEPIEENS